MSLSIPETGQEVEIVRMHPIDWTGSVRFIAELQNTLATRTLIINDAFSMNQGHLIDTMIQWVRNYIIQAHFMHYQRIGYNLGAYTPAKGRSMLSEEVPEVFVHIARHLARPRLLIDGSVSLPIPSAPICNGVRYNFLDNGAPNAMADNDVVRNMVQAGAPNAVLAAINVDGTAIHYRPRLYPALRRDFAGLKMYKSVGPEGLCPARLCYWSEHSNQFIHFLDLNSTFDKAIFDIDIVLVPLIMPQMPIVPLPRIPANNADDLDAAGQRALYNAVLNHYASVQPAPIQWMALNSLTGVQGVMTRSIFFNREASAFHVNPTRTPMYSLNEFMSTVGSELKEMEFPSLGVSKQITELRVLANDLGSGHPTSQHRNNRRDRGNRSSRGSKIDRKARISLSSNFDTSDQTDDGPATLEEKKSYMDSSDQDTLQTEAKNNATTNQRRRKGRPKK